MDKAAMSSLERVMRVRHVTGVAKAQITLELDLEGISEADLDAMSPAALADFAKAARISKKKVHPAGSFVGLGNEGPDDPFWADVYDGRFGEVFFGHSPFPEALEPVQFPHATALDLGAVFGGRLAAAVLRVTEPTVFVSVPSRGKFAKTLWEND